MNDVNLIPAGRLVARRGKTRWYLWATLCGVYGAAVAAGAVTFHVAYAGAGQRQTQQLAAADQQIEQDNRVVLALRRQLAETGTALETTKALRGQPDWSQLLTGLSGQLGDEIVLSRYQLATMAADKRPVTAESCAFVPGLPLGPFLRGCRHTLLLVGYGKSQDAVSQFVLRLEGSGAFDLVRLVSSSRQTFLKGEAVAFSAECSF